jgi:hypothetical protein
MHGGVREGGSAAEHAPPRCRPLMRGESMYRLVGCLMRCKHTHHCDGISGTYSALTGATNISACLPRCGPGYYSPYSGHSTLSEACFPCPFNFRSPIGSSSVSNCTACAPGFFGPAGGPCTPCPSGTYKQYTGTAAACTPCPLAGQWSPTRSVDAAVYLSPRRACLHDSSTTNVKYYVLSYHMY